MLLKPTAFCSLTSTFRTTPTRSLFRLLHTHPRAAVLTHPRPRPHPLLLTTLGLTTVTTSFLLSPTLTRLDASPFSSTPESPYSHGRDAKVPLSADGGRTLNPAAIKQISLGSILGLGAGVLVSAFSRMLVLVLGLSIVLTQFAARRGFNIIPVDRLQRYVKGVNLRSAINDNAAFKISFGLMFALTAFGEL